ncbi:MAG: hypothetical protein ACSW78_06725, partial [Lachnospiraceae bacterium]
MAAERMPDFNEIDSLIGNLGKLEKSFSKITSEYDLHEKELREECAEALKRQSAHFLDEIPVEELKNSKAGIRTGLLEDAGYHTLYDLYKASDWKLQNIEGIGEKQVASIRGILTEFLVRLSARARIRLTMDQDDVQSRKLIHRICKFRKIEQIRREAEPITDEVTVNIRALTESVPIRSRLHWIFSFGNTKKETLRAVSEILTYCRSAQYNLVRNLVSRYGEALQMNAD